ncbi:MAG: hypothetical protein ACFFCI_17190, partial [Promethearchaeota archaeon]
CNGSNDIYYVNTSGDTDFYSPWVHGNTIRLLYSSDPFSIEYYGYDIDYYEYVNATSNFHINSDTWQFNYQEVTNGFNDYGTAKVDNSTATYVALYGEYIAKNEFGYETGAYSEIFQDFTIPSGPVVDAYISFNYYCQYALPTNDHYLYVKINNQKIFSKGMLDISDLGKRKWLSSGKLHTDAWDNLTAIFSNNIYEQQFNISLGFRIGSGYTYSSSYSLEEGLTNIIYFDNVSLVVTTKANSTQNGINLLLNGEMLEDRESWGHSNRTFTGLWDTNPIIITLNCSSPYLTFDMDTTIYGYKQGASKINQQGTDGISYKILDNGTIYWEFLHNLYVPAEYSDLNFIINKPKEWDFLYAKDSTLQKIPFDQGKPGDPILRVNETYAIFPGWWSFKATSPNYMNISNTKLLKQSQWVQSANFTTGESTQITAQLKNNNKIPSDVGEINLTIYHPNGTIFYTESKTPVGGNVTFSRVTFGSFNTSGGLYEYTLFWSNGTALGGLKSSFIINHQSSISLLKPDDAIIDLRTEGFVGDVIPLRIYLKDSENDKSISDAIVSYNWTGGSTLLFSESALGIYETVLNTGELLERGLYNIVIKSSKLGFFESNLTLEINLGEETNLQVLESDYNIELHANGTIRFKFTDYTGDGIDGALVNISISNKSLYTISYPGNGTYNIEFSTLFIDDIGIYQLSVNFTAVAYEPQYYIYQFQIIKQSVELSVYINSEQISENSLKEAEFYQEVNVSVRAISHIDKDLLSGGVISCISGNYYRNLTEYGDHWYNTSIICSPDNFSFGINFIYLQFEHPNYRTATFGFQLLIHQIPILVVPISFEDTINAEIGDTINIELQLQDPNTNASIENALVTYVWYLGYGEINETTPGTYQISLELPDNLRGNYKFDLLITLEGSVYKVTEFSFVVVIGEPIIPPRDGFPSFFLWIIIGVLVSVAFVLGILSIRSYVILPRKRRKGAELLSKTQRFKDMINIQAIVVIHRFSGIPIYSKSYSILERHKKELFSGFIQAITTIGEEFTEKEVSKAGTEDATEGYGIEKIIELDFKYFYCLIADKGDVRVVFVLKEKSSERLKNQISSLISALTLKLSIDLDNWDGSLDIFEKSVPPIIEEYFELYYKGSFTLSKKIDLINIRKERDLSKMEIRVLNVVESLLKRYNNVIQLNYIIE